jgi:hypothetical protein
MARKPESVFIESIHKHFPSKTSPHREKMNNPYRGGTADMWYSGHRGDLWIEYKFLAEIPRVVLPDLTPLQRQWLDRRYDEGRKVWVIVGCHEGGVVYKSRHYWNCPMSAEKFREQLVDRKQLADSIYGSIF